MSTFATKRQGFTLVEAIVVIAISVMIFGAIFTSFQYSLKLVANSRAKLSAISLANDRMEYIRSLPYDSVGTVAGIPNGPIPQYATTTLNQIVFSERVLVEYVDDRADGLLSATTTDSNGIPSDYKRVKVEIAWRQYGTLEKISLITNIVPRSIETTTGGGTVRVNVIDSNSQPLAGAAVTLRNNTTTSTINITKNTDSTGTALFSGAPAASNYEVSVTKSGYSVDKTYVATTSNPNPITAPFSLLAADISTVTFQVDALSDMSIYAYSTLVDDEIKEDFSATTNIATSTNVTITGGRAELSQNAGVYNSSGHLYLPVTPSSLKKWEAITVAATTSAQTTTKVSLYTVGTSTYTLIPDTDLPGNSLGYSGSIIDISSLSVATYPSLVLKASFNTSNSSISPTLDEMGVYYRASEVARSNFSITAHGNKVVGYRLDASPIYKVNLSATTDASGEVLFPQTEFDTYSVDIPITYTLARACPSMPIIHKAGIKSTVELLLVAYVADSLLTTVVSDAGIPIPGASVTLSRTGFSDTVHTNSCGQAFFSAGVLSATDYTIGVLKPSFNSKTVNPYDLNGNSSTKIILNEI
jgi:type II secretory pathway pseudopilin PulG